MYNVTVNRITSNVYISYKIRNIESNTVGFLGLLERSTDYIVLCLLFWKEELVRMLKQLADFSDFWLISALLNYNHNHFFRIFYVLCIRA